MEYCLTVGDRSYTTDKVFKSKMFYNILLKQIFIEPTAIKLKWEDEFSLDLNDNDWKNIFTTRVKNIPDKKVAMFNYKVLHNILPCGYIVNKWDNKTPAICPKCPERHTIKHMLFECDEIKGIWVQLSTCLLYTSDAADD